jgi:hypothetical protein
MASTLDDRSCEACRSRRATERVEDEGAERPYRLCRACAGRLHGFALRPIEWYNLTVAHGPTYLTCDDFYDQDGVAGLHAVPAAPDQRIPDPESLAGSAARLVDYVTTRYRIDARTERALRATDPDALEAEVGRRLGSGRHAPWVAAKVCAHGLGERAGPIVRTLWQEAVGRGDHLGFLTDALIRCLPREEGLRRAFDALSAMDPLRREQQMEVLAPFRAPETLDWIEATVPGRNVRGAWGSLAARSGVGWDRLSTWLANGRPLSLVALDALLATAHAVETPGPDDLIAPGLPDPPARAELDRALAAYAARDPVPRVTQTIERIGNAARLLVRD